MKNRAAALVLAAGAIGLFPGRLPARTVRVPQDCPMIGLAAAGARDGDTIEVDDGFYFEKDIVLEKRLVVRSKNLFGAVIYGSYDNNSSVFIVRAPVEISGFIIKNAWNGIMQRDSPDVEWKGRDLAFFNILIVAVYVNDRAAHVGFADLTDIIVSGCDRAFATNDARGLSARRFFVAGAPIAFDGFNHRTFRVDDGLLWNCRRVKSEVVQYPPTASYNRVEMGPHIRVLGPGDLPAASRELPRLLESLLASVDGRPWARPADARRRKRALLCLVEGDAFVEAGDQDLAEERYGAALRESTALGLEEVRWQSSFGLARIAESRERIGPAVDYYKQTIALIERIGLGLPLRTFQSNFRLDKIGLYETVVRLLLRLHESAPSKGYDREAFLFAEKSKARGFLASLQSGNETVPADAAPGLKTEENRIRRDITRLQLDLQEPGIPPGRRRALITRLDRTENAWRNFLVRIRRRDSASARFHVSDPYDFTAIRDRLTAPSTAVLEFMVGEKSSAAFLLTRDELTIATLPPLSVLGPLVEKYLQFLSLGGGADFPARAGGARLGALLLAPFREKLKTGLTSLIVVPDGPLHYLPFETLIDEGRSPRFLIEDFDVRYGPSANCLIHLAERPAPARYTRDFLGLANSFRMRTFALSVEEERVFPALPEASREIRDISRRFDPARTTILLDRDAQEAAFKSLPLSDFRVIHLAAHGLFDDRHWWRSALILLPDKAGLEDGFLQPDDIYGLRLVPELLVLSGCETGIGRLEKGEGVNGLSYAFFYAGARSLLLSLWSVNDRATADFMGSFYDYWLGGKPKSEALRLAKIQALRSKNGNPFYWAGFVLLGDGGRGPGINPWGHGGRGTAFYAGVNFRRVGSSLD
jgi:hypothetical protein